MAASRAQLDQSTWEAARAEGERLSADDTITFTLEAVGPELVSAHQNVVLLPVDHSTRWDEQGGRACAAGADRGH